MTFLSLALVVLLWACAAVFAFFSIRYSRTPQGSVAWVVFLLATPMIAVPAYLFLGHTKVKNYILARRVSSRVIKGLAKQAEEHPPSGDDDQIGYAGFEKIAEFPIVSGNSMDILIDGQETFDAMFTALQGAQSYVLVQFYIIRDDTLGQRLKHELIDCRMRGLSVRLLYDSVGCSKLPETYLMDLRHAGVDIMDAHALRGPKTRFTINFRNHRKTLVVDGKVGFLGGLNVGDEYMGQDPTFGDWRDTHCRICGPIVSQLQLVFVEDWHWATEVSLLDQLHWHAERAVDGMDALLMATGPADTMETGSLYFCSAISAARERVWIASPYLVPENDILTALKLAALRGADVRILVPDVIDHYIPWLAAFAYFDELMEAGVQIWRYDAGFMHQKVLLVDNSIASIGTTNMDNRSCRLNFEATVMVFDKRATQQLAKMLEADFERSWRLTKTLDEQSFVIRNGAGIARLFAPIL